MLALVLWLGGSAAADTVVTQGKMTGKLPDGSFWYDGGNGQWISAYFASVLRPDGSDAILVSWYGTSGGNWFSAYGYAPMSSVKVTGDTVTVSFDPAEWREAGRYGEPGTMTGTFGSCSALWATTWSMTGDLTTSMGWYCYHDSMIGPCVYSTRSTGVHLQLDATFAGRVGGIDIAPGGGCNAQLSLQKGQRSFTLKAQ